MTLITTILNHAQIREKNIFCLSGITQCSAAAVIWHVKHNNAGHMSS